MCFVSVTVPALLLLCVWCGQSEREREREKSELKKTQNRKTEQSGCPLRLRKKMYVANFCVVGGFTRERQNSVCEKYFWQFVFVLTKFSALSNINKLKDFLGVYFISNYLQRCESILFILFAVYMSFLPDRLSNYYNCMIKILHSFLLNSDGTYVHFRKGN